MCLPYLETQHESNVPNQCNFAAFFILVCFHLGWFVKVAKSIENAL